MSLIKTEAIVVKVSDYSESTRLVTLFSPEHGRIRLLAKGARRLKSQSRGLLEPFSRIDATLYLKDPTGLGTLKECAAIAIPSKLRADYDRWLLGSLVLELIDRATLPGDGYEALFNLVCSYLDELQDTNTPRELTAIVLLSMLRWFGFSPSFDRCGLCGGGENFTGVLLEQSFAVCSNCTAPAEHFRRMPPGTMKILHILATTDAKMRDRLRISPGQMDQILSLLVALLQFHLDITLASAHMLVSEQASPRIPKRAGSSQADLS